MAANNLTGESNMTASTESINDTPEESGIIVDPNLTRNDGKVYVITKKYERYDDTKESEESQDDPIELNTELEDIELNHSRVASMANFTALTKTETIGLRNNLITQIEGIAQLTNLREIEFYDNQITKIENLDSLVNLE